MWRYVAVHMGAVLWSAALHAALHSTQPLQPLHLFWTILSYDFFCNSAYILDKLYYAL